eukprot:TRINITY_DN14861_c0_g1_i1.p1 TRINITY_DN14861_c0_g1~~TRINITY_DN14861_c0_g1_i1.p1  ORF type:complete len:265 (+),score=17.09 TRINITY_DN14861_c0_g1_i1:101-895(+)
MPPKRQPLSPPTAKPTKSPTTPIRNTGRAAPHTKAKQPENAKRITPRKSSVQPSYGSSLRDGTRKMVFHYIPCAKKLVQRNKERIWTLEKFSKRAHNPAEEVSSFVYYKEPVKYQRIRMMKEIVRPEYVFPLKHDKRKNFEAAGMLSSGLNEIPIDSKLTENIINDYLGFTDCTQPALEQLNFPHPTEPIVHKISSNTYSADHSGTHFMADSSHSNNAIRNEASIRNFNASKSIMKERTMSKYGLLAIGTLLDNSSISVKHAFT